MALLSAPGCHCYSGRGGLVLRPVSCLRRSTPAADLSIAAADHSLDAAHLRRAADIADLSAGLTSPHPNFGCVIARGHHVVGEGFLYAQGTKCAELQAVEAAGGLCRGATAYLNLEPGDCYGDETPVSSLIKAGITRVVVGLRNPLLHLRGNKIGILRNAGLQVDVLAEDLQGKVFEVASCYPLSCEDSTKKKKKKKKKITGRRRKEGEEEPS